MREHWRAALAANCKLAINLRPYYLLSSVWPSGKSTAKQGCVFNAFSFDTQVKFPVHLVARTMLLMLSCFLALITSVFLQTLAGSSAKSSAIEKSRTNDPLEHHDSHMFSAEEMDTISMEHFVESDKNSPWIKRNTVDLKQNSEPSDLVSHDGHSLKKRWLLWQPAADDPAIIAMHASCIRVGRAHTEGAQIWEWHSASCSPNRGHVSVSCRTPAGTLGGAIIYCPEGQSCMEVAHIRNPASVPVTVAKCVPNSFNTPMRRMLYKNRWKIGMVRSIDIWSGIF